MQEVLENKQKNGYANSKLLGLLFAKGPKWITTQLQNREIKLDKNLQFSMIWKTVSIKYTIPSIGLL